MDQYAQIAGAVLVLLGYVLSQLGRVDTDSNKYLIVNLVGSMFLASAALWGSQWGFLLLNGTWAVVSFISLLRKNLGAEARDHAAS